jgi:bifunctional DNase/RNase
LENRPDPYIDQLLKILEPHGQVNYVVITELRREIYYSKIFVKKDLEVTRVSVRPYEAIAVASRLRVAIYADPMVMAVAGVTPLSQFVKRVTRRIKTAAKKFLAEVL